MVANIRRREVLDIDPWKMNKIGMPQCLEHPLLAAVARFTGHGFAHRSWTFAYFASLDPPPSTELVEAFYDKVSKSQIFEAEEMIDDGYPNLFEGGPGSPTE
eukprot:Polyplicarium_translucidae@DN1294_c0_g1_i1.p3